MTALAVLILAVHLASEWPMRKGRARRFSPGAFDRGSSAVVSAASVLAIVGAVAARYALEVGRFTPSRALGWSLLLVMLAATVLRYWSMHALGEFFSRTLVVIDGQHVVEQGPYRWVRHPGYLARMAVLLAWTALISANWVAALIVASTLFGAYAYRIRAEEVMLLASLGEPYREYARRTWRLLPFVY